VPVSYTASAAVTATLGARTKGADLAFTGIITPLVPGGVLAITISPI
jgi:hypothetical protein